MRREHIVPLSTQAVEVLVNVRGVTGQGKYMFLCNRAKGRAMSDMTVNAALRRLASRFGTICVLMLKKVALTLLRV